MKRYPAFAVTVLLLAMLACSLGGGPQPTSAPPTETLAPTVPPVPTNTPTPLPTDTPTPTPDLTATAAAQATQTASDVLTELDKLLGDTDVPYKEGHLAWRQTEPMTITLNGPGHQAQAIGEKLTAADFIFKSDVTWNASGILVCGAIFRSEPNVEEGKQYQFLFLRFSGLPAWDIEVHEFGKFKNAPVKIKFSDALDLSNGATNQFVLVGQGEKFTLFLNKVRQGTYYDYSKQLSEGTFGFFAMQDSGKGSCKYENSWLWVLK